MRLCMASLLLSPLQNLHCRGLVTLLRASKKSFLAVLECTGPSILVMSDTVLHMAWARFSRRSNSSWCVRRAVSWKGKI